MDPWNTNQIPVDGIAGVEVIEEKFA